MRLSANPVNGFGASCDMPFEYRIPCIGNGASLQGIPMRIAFVVLSALLVASTTVEAQPVPAPSVEAKLCRSQLELLVSGGKLTKEETARFESQCACLERSDSASSTAECAAPAGEN